VKVTIEGDGGLIINGAGLEEIRLRPGSYKVHADKDGAPVPLERDVVSIGTGGREVVRVKLEASPSPVAANTEKGAFVLLAAGKERGFDTLAEAVQSASSGDTIEVRGNGPFLSEPIDLKRTALTIRAGDGFRPAIHLSPEASQRTGSLLATNAALTLEGLELHRSPPQHPEKGGWTAVNSNEAPLRAANCRFRAPIRANPSPLVVFHNCDFLPDEGSSVVGMYRSGARLISENCLHRTTFPIVFQFENAAVSDVSIEIKRNTFTNEGSSFWLLLDNPLPGLSDPPQRSKAVHIDVSSCIFDSPSVLGVEQTRKLLDQAAVLTPTEAEMALHHLLQWRGERNLFAAGSSSVRWSADKRLQPPHGPKDLTEWKRFWGAGEVDSLQGSVHFQGGNLLSRTGAALDRLTPADFRLRPDSAGYRAGPDGKDLGADVDLVGPGPAYQRWKKTPGYQEWLKETGQQK